MTVESLGIVVLVIIKLKWLFWLLAFSSKGSGSMNSELCQVYVHKTQVF